MNTEQRRLIKSNLDILLRHKKLIVICLFSALAGGLAYYLQLPKTYKCTALIRYQQQSVNPTVMSPDDTRTRTRDVVNTVSQQITSRSSLEELIKEFDLYKSMQETVAMEKIVDQMRKHHIETRLLEGGDVFEVSFLGLDQQKVMDVTNALAQKFIEENLRFRQAQASQTSTYIRDELKMAKKGLDEKELIMRDYKLRYYNEMPEQLQNNTNRLNGLHEQYQNLQTSQLDLERTRLLVQEQVAARIAVLNQQAADVSAAPTTTAGELNSIEQIRLRLQNLQPRYTDKHPEVKRLKKLLEKLENAQPAGANGDQPTQDPQLRQLRQQLKDIDFNIRQLKDDRQQLNTEIKKYESWIAAAPIREAEWAALTRDYQQLNEHYQRLVTQSLQAESAISLEKQLQGSQFKIVDTAHYPEKPLKPDFKKIFLLALVLGLGLGGGLSFGIELMGTSFKDPAELEKYINVEVVCALPKIPTRSEAIKARITKTTETLLVSLFAAGVVSAIIYYWTQGMIII